MSSALKDNGSTARWRKIRQRILERDQFTCQSCGLEGNTVDHITPRSLGGGDDEFNLQCLCYRCNSAKGGINRLNGKNGQIWVHIVQLAKSVKIGNIGKNWRYLAIKGSYVHLKILRC
jgi:5-methylcytosine-specific restriction endonuclease McrA